MALAEIRERVTGGVVEFQEAGVTERYGEKFLAASMAAWERRWKAAVNRYRRIVI
jgi:hypothetical protein